MTHPLPHTPRRAIAMALLLAAALVAWMALGSTAAQAAPPTDRFPVTVKHRLGTTTIPRAPVRIVALGGADQDTAIALGVTPVGMNNLNNQWPRGVPWVTRRIAGADVEIFSTYPEMPYEKIAALKPDLILAGAFFSIDRHYNLLSRIAPTIADVRGPGKDTWQLQTLQVGRALGRTRHARALITGTQRKILSARRSHREFQGATFSVAAVFDRGKVNVLNTDSETSVTFMRQLGFRLSPRVRTLGGHTGKAELSTEQLSRLDADVMLAYFFTKDVRTSIVSSPLYTRLSAVRGKRVVELPNTTWFSLRGPTVLSIPFTLKRVVPALSRAAKRA